VAALVWVTRGQQKSLFGAIQTQVDWSNILEQPEMFDGLFYPFTPIIEKQLACPSHQPR